MVLSYEKQYYEWQIVNLSEARQAMFIAAF